MTDTSAGTGTGAGTGAGGNAGSGGAGGAGGAGDAATWDSVRQSLSGGNADRAQLLSSFTTPDALFERLNTQPPDWRAQMAGDNADDLQFLNKYADPQQAFKAWRSATTKLSEGGRVKVPGENATPEERAEYARAIGVPDKVEAYKITAKPAQGYTETEGDKAFIPTLTTKVHEMLARGAAPQDIMNFAVQTYYDIAAQNIIESETQAAAKFDEGVAANKKLWGDEYDKNIHWAIAGARQFFPGDDKAFEEFAGIKLDSGHKLLDHPLMQRIFAQVGSQFSEDPFFLQNAGQNAGFEPEKRKQEILAMKNGTAAQQREYAKLSAPGGELERINEGLARRAGRAA